MEFLEVVRRWMWIFFRVETEWGQYIHEDLDRSSISADACIVRTYKGPLPDEILLGDISGTLDSPLSPSFSE